MARGYRVSVNGKSYDVVVEELGAATAPVQAAPAVAPTQTATPAPAAAVPVAAAPKTAARAGSASITSPMPGKIWKLHVREGDTVTEGQLVLVLEAMKMENEIFAPAGGKIAQVNCKEGDSVNTGDTLVVIG